MCRQSPLNDKIENLGMPPDFVEENGRSVQSRNRLKKKMKMEKDIVSVCEEELHDYREDVRNDEEGVEISNASTQDDGKRTIEYHDISSDSDNDDDRNNEKNYDDNNHNTDINNQQINRIATETSTAITTIAIIPPPLKLPSGWIEVLDPEECSVIPIGTRVLVTDVNEPQKRYGNVILSIRNGVRYKVQLDWNETDDEREAAKERLKRIARQKRIDENGVGAVWGENENIVDDDSVLSDVDIAYDESDSDEGDEEEGEEGMIIVSRHLLEVIARPSFYFNMAQSLCAWTIEEIFSHPQHSAPLTLTGIEWTQLCTLSVKRRSFDNFGVDVDEYHHVLSDAIFYIDYPRREVELAVLRVQRWYRSKCYKTQHTLYLTDPSSGYQTHSFSFLPFPSVLDAQNLLSGWALLRRTSKEIRRFVDPYHTEWTEFLDLENFDNFYWSEKSDRYQWNKPEVTVFTVEEIEARSLLCVGQEVLYWFDGTLKPQLVTVTRLRVDDSTGEILHDVLSVDGAMRKICLPRSRISVPQLSSEEVRHLEQEKQWAKQIRQAYLTDERKEKQYKMSIIESEIAKESEILRSRKQFPESLKSATRIPQIASNSLRSQQRNEGEKEEKEEKNTYPWMGMNNKPTALVLLESVYAHHPELHKARQRRADAELSDHAENSLRIEIAARDTRVMDMMHTLLNTTIAALAAMGAKDVHQVEVRHQIEIDVDVGHFAEMAAMEGIGAESVKTAMKRAAEFRVMSQMRTEQRNERLEVTS